MYQFYKNGKNIATINTPIWTKMQSNGCFGPANYDNAEGVVLNSVIYHLANRPELEGKETIVVSEISEEQYHKQEAEALNQIKLNTDSALADLSILIAGLMPEN